MQIQGLFAGRFPNGRRLLLKSCAKLGQILWKITLKQPLPGSLNQFAARAFLQAAREIQRHLAAPCAV
jgi:hypothetical protein